MARRAGGWSLQRDSRTGVYTVRFRHAGDRIHRSTGESDRGAAQKEATRIYAEVISGRRRKVVGRASGDLDELFGAWILAHGPGRAPETIATYEGYCAGFGAYFRSLAAMTDASCGDYARARLRQVSASTVRKELSALRLFLAWALEEGYLAEPVTVPGIPKRAIGTPKTKGAKVRVQLTREQVEALIAAIPETTRRRRGDRDGRPVPARAFVIVMAETGLRRATLWRLRAPEHYHRGAEVLTVSRDIDKAREGRPLPLSARARAALDAVCPDEGPIFGRADLRHTLAEASRDIGLPPHLAGRVSYHDLRHAFLSDLAASGASLAGLQYLAGHRHASTSARYIHATQKAAEEALRARDTAARSTPKTRKVGSRR